MEQLPLITETKTDEPMTVSVLAERIDEVLKEGLSAKLKVVGEISKFTDRGHWWITIKDEKAAIDCVMWSSRARYCRFTPERGQQVLITGQVGFYGPQGRTQIYIDKLEPVGAGALELEFRRLCEQLREKGYFEEQRKKSMPEFPEHIAIITSETGAALQDVIRTARHRWAGIRLSLLDVRVQGEDAAREIVRAITLLSEQYEDLEIDAVILTRGGGSLEDLWSFNERIVADAIYSSRVPIAVGVGHETDVTIAELVADLRCSTPTQAAAMLVPDAASEMQRVDEAGRRLAGSLRRAGQQARSKLESLATRPALLRPTERFVTLRQRLDHLRTSLIHGLRQQSSVREKLDGMARDLHKTCVRYLTSRRDCLEALNGQLRSIGHQSVLGRGYSITMDRKGRILRSVMAARKAGHLVTHLKDGKVESHVVTNRDEMDETDLFD